MKYGSLEWANDLLSHAKSELDRINAADEKGKAAAEGLGLTQYYTNLIKSLEDEISKGNYKSENDPLTDYTHDLYSPSSDEEKRKLETAQKEADDYFNHIATTDNSIPGYENTPVDAGVLSGMLTDDPKIRKAALAWMNSLSDIDTDAIKRVIASEAFKDMYGKQDFDWKGGKAYNAAEAKAFIEGYNNPTGIENPADYMSKVTFEKDTDGDEDIDTKVTKVTDN